MKQSDSSTFVEKMRCNKLITKNLFCRRNNRQRECWGWEVSSEEYQVTGGGKWIFYVNSDSEGD